MKRIDSAVTKMCEPAEELREVFCMPKAKMILMLGERDGQEIPISPSDRPDVFYAVPNLDEQKITETKGNDNKRALRDKLAVLAYEYDVQTSTSTVFRMKRNAALDKVAQT